MLLEIREITKEFVQKNRIVTAVKDINLDVEEGDFISIMGKSGSGKSTLLNLIAGILYPTRGEILYQEDDTATYHDKEVSLYRNQQIGYVLQGQTPIQTLTVLENVLLPYFVSGDGENPREYALYLLKRLGIDELANSFPKELSGGELKRMSIARALINRPKLILADEPTSDLDGYHTRKVLELFREIAQEGAAIIMVTHEEEAAKAANIIYHMESGNLSK